MDCSVQRDLEDLLQESYLQLMRALKQYRGEARVTTFVHRVCMNVGLMYVQSKRRRPEELMAELPDRSTHESEGPERAAISSQALSVLQRALATMSEDKASVFAYHDVLGLKPEEIAEIAQCPVNTVRSRLHRARAEFTATVSALTVLPKEKEASDETLLSRGALGTGRR